MRQIGQPVAICALSILMLLAPTRGARAVPTLDQEGTTAESDDYKRDANQIPVSGTTDFNRGQWDKVDPLNTAEHELIHVIGFSVSSPLFSAAVNGSNEIKVGGTVYGITDGTSHLDPTKSVTINGTTYDQSKDLMQPNKVPNERIGPQDQMILNAIYNYSGTGGLQITVNFTGPAFSAADTQAINDAVAAVEFLFPAGANPHKITWDAQNSVCGDPPSDEAGLQVCELNVPEPSSGLMVVTFLALTALASQGWNATVRRHPG